MRKELIICILIIGIILIGNYVTGSYEEQAIQEISNNLNEVKVELNKEEKNEKLIEEKLETLNSNWSKIYPKLAYFIEHDELEKVETSLVVLTSFSSTEEYEQAISEIDKSMFVLKHIKDKNKLSLKNIF